MSSIWTAASDLDYYAQFNPEPPEENRNRANRKRPPNSRPPGKRRIVTR